MKPFPQTIETPRLILRQPCEEIAEAMTSFEIRYDPSYNPNGTQPRRPYQKEAWARQFIKAYTTDKFRGHTLYFITSKESLSQALGRIKIIKEFGEYNLEWHNDYHHTGHGYATEALQAILNIPILQNQTVAAYINQNNHPSIKLAHHLGFKNVLPLNDFSKYLYNPLSEQLSLSA